MTATVIPLPTRQRDLAIIVNRIARFKEAGLTTFQALACSLDESDWDKVYAAMRAQAGAARS